MIVSRFTSLIENFEICCCQVTELFGPKYCIANALPSKSPCNLGYLAEYAMSVFLEMIENTVLP